MADHLRRWLPGIRQIQVVVICALLTAYIATADYLFGPKISLSIFYLAPVAIAAWHSGLGLATAFSIICSIGAVWVEFPSFSSNQVQIESLWNGVAHIGILYVVAKLVSRQRDYFEREKLLARNDYLTGVMNRRAFMERIDLVFNLAVRQRSPMTLAYIDVDDFKQVNDTHGHQIGDAVLLAVATTLKNFCRRSDLIARLGGDEFVLVLPDTNPEAARIVLAKLDQGIREATTNPLKVSCSVGVVTFIHLPESVSRAMEMADSLMYEVKKNRAGISFVIFDREDDRRDGHRQP